MRRTILSKIFSASLVLASLAANAQAKPDRLKAVLAQMDEGSKSFRSAEATIQKQQYERIVRDTTTETGTTYFLRNGSSTQMGAKFANGQTVECKGGNVRLYTAGTNHLDQYSLKGANQARFETYLTLGFGGSGSDLAKAWAITDLGTEKMSDGGKAVEVEKLDLVSRDAGVRGNFTHITIWIDAARDVTLKQEFYTPNGDTQTAIYSNIRLNQKIELNKYAIQCKGKCS